MVGLLGPNGAGKTTCFYMIVGLVPADGGDVYIDDAKLSHLPMHARAQLGLSYLPQEASVFRKLNVEENIRAVLELQKLPAAEINDRLRAAQRNCTSPTCAMSMPPPFPAVSGGASKSPGRWRRGRASSCSTSPSPGWIPSPS